MGYTSIETCVSLYEETLCIPPSGYSASTGIISMMGSYYPMPPTWSLPWADGTNRLYLKGHPAALSPLSLQHLITSRYIT